ncbi:MAG: hypothetical protein EXS67_02930 [Candidatus Margulisbacteria bacterium]|nr:hypothetical protein [Candidatus Margulisiibacteriota bacterium]
MTNFVDTKSEKTQPKDRIKTLFQTIKTQGSPALSTLFEKTFNIIDMSLTFVTVDLEKAGAIQKVRDIDHEQTMATFHTPQPIRLGEDSFRIGAHFTDAKGVELAQQGAELQQNLMLAYALTGTHEGPTSTHFMHGDRCTIIASNDNSNPDAHKELLSTLGVDKASFNEALNYRNVEVLGLKVDMKVSSHGFKMGDGIYSVHDLKYFNFLSNVKDHKLPGRLMRHLKAHNIIGNKPKKSTKTDGKVKNTKREDIMRALNTFEKECKDIGAESLTEIQKNLIADNIIYYSQTDVPVETKGMNIGDHQLMGQIAVGGTGNMVIDSKGVAQTIRPDGTNGSLCIVARKHMPGADGKSYAVVAFGIEGSNPLKTNMHTGDLHLKAARHEKKVGGGWGSEKMALADRSFFAGLGSKEVKVTATELKALTVKMTLLKEARENQPTMYKAFADKLLSAETPEKRNELYQSFTINYFNEIIKIESQA